MSYRTPAMIDLLELHKYFIRGHLTEGDAAADFTMGNGYDTEFLSKTVGPAGRVFAFDIQKSALESTATRLHETGCPDNVTLILDSHSNAKKYIDRPLRAGMFNLGWLPGGDKSVTTRRETTLPAIADALELLDHGGVLLVAVYPGHAEGEAEGGEVADYFASLDRHKICASQFRIINSPESPFFFVVEKK